MLHFNLAYLLDSKGIVNPYNFLIKQGLTPNVATRCVRGKIEQLKLKHISRICLALHCTPNDLLVWEDSEEPLPAGHPLEALVKDQAPVNIRQELKHLSMEQIKEVQALITRMNSEGDPEVK